MKCLHPHYIRVKPQPLSIELGVRTEESRLAGWNKLTPSSVNMLLTS